MGRRKNIKRSKNKCDRCIICGERIAGKFSREHIIPLAVLNYAEENDRLFCLEQFVRSGINKAASHVRCNNEKGNYILNHRDIDRLYCDSNRKSWLHRIIKKFEPEIERMKASQQYVTNEFKLNGVVVKAAESYYGYDKDTEDGESIEENVEDTENVIETAEDIAVGSEDFVNNWESGEVASG